MTLEPAIGLLDRYIVHIVLQVGDDKGNRWELGKVCRKVCKGLIGTGRHIREINPRVMFTCIKPIACRTIGKSNAWHTFGIASEGIRLGNQLPSQVWW